MSLKNKNLYYVGGVVRDELLGIPSFDIDYCYEGDAIEFAQQERLNIIKINPDFGTVRVKLSDTCDIDIASTRTETYPKKGHLPKVSNIGCQLKDDMIRRDFTINAMARRTTGGDVIDYFNGLNDIKNKELRVLHENSFVDDPTRIIRGLKFSIRFGFLLNSETKELQDEYLKNINYDMSYHRIKKELIETFNLNKAEVYDKFIQEKIYKLLGEDVRLPDINGTKIHNAIKNVNTNFIWLMYLAPIICTNENTNINVCLTRTEKRIIDWAKNLKSKNACNNTPEESIIIRELLDNV